MLLRIFFLSLSLVLFSLSTHAQELRDQLLDENFKRLVNRTLDNIRATAGKPVSLFKSPRESNESIIKAMELIQIDKNYELGRKHLRRAIAINKRNFFAYLLMGITLELGNKTVESTPYYLGFLKYSLKSSFMEHGIPIDAKDIHFMRTHVRELLLKRNVDISEGIKNLDLKIRRVSLFDFLGRKKPSEVIYGTVFYLFIVFGLIYYYYRKNEGPSTFFRWESILFKLVWSAFAIGVLEVMQMLLAAPYLFSPLIQRTVLLVIVAGGYVFLSLFKEKRDIQELLKNPQLRQCSHCKKVIPKINIECPNCKKHLQ